MPLYTSSCLKCFSEQEYIASMANSSQVPKCTECGGKCMKTITSPPAMYGDLNDFSLENHGKGRFNPQLKQYVTSVKDAESKAAKRGWEVYGK